MKSVEHIQPALRYVYHKSIMHPALHVPELVDQIIGYLDKDEQKRCAPICQFWSEIALDHWYPELACLLAAMKKGFAYHYNMAYHAFDSSSQNPAQRHGTGSSPSLGAYIVFSAVTDAPMMPLLFLEP
ncbi:hypothetical protein D9758_010150 [Tetrapyrgos nigripes]|uniref:F-box domain-containing protein n=1 Tax=Tetrapyrgos nigripes TaxID=182062 RepID=A0A8H5CUP8_9AGAR|nr:hypothetical protein D9758_010150 [Tetrapyrgos nigripes]